MADMTFEVHTSRWRQAAPNADVLVRGRSGLRKLGPAMNEVLTGIWQGNTELTITFSRELDKRAKNDVTKAIEKIARDAVGEDWVDSINDDEGWSGPRYAIDERFGPSFGGHDAGSDGTLLAIWPSDSRFRVISTYDLHYAGTSWASVSHWHPDSMTSGSWFGSLSLLEPGVMYEHRYRDEDGSYFTLLPEPTEPEAMADAVESFLTGEYINNAESWFTVLYGLVGSKVSELGEFRIGILPGTEDPGYELSDLRIDPPDSAAAILRDRCRPTDERKKRLLDGITTHLDEQGEGETVDDFVGVWAELVAALKQ